MPCGVCRIGNCRPALSSKWICARDRPLWSLSPAPPRCRYILTPTIKFVDGLFISACGTLPMQPSMPECCVVDSAAAHALYRTRPESALHANPFRCHQRLVHLDQHRPRRHARPHADEHRAVQRQPCVVALGNAKRADGGIAGSSNSCGASSSAPHACGATLDSFGTLRGRVGYALGATGNWLPYATGGLAAGEVHAWDSLLPSSGDAFQVGWTAGGGVESALTHNWSAKVEYLYLDLGSQTFDVAPGVPEKVSFKTSIIRAGLSYEFH